MNKWKTARHWHNRIGLILSIPMLIIGLSAILLAHNKSLGLRQVMLTHGDRQDHTPELRAVLPQADGSTLIGTRSGLWQLQAGQAPQALLAKVEVRDLALTRQRVWLLAREGIWLGENGHFRRISKQEGWKLTVINDDKLLLATRNQGVLTLDTRSLKLAPDAALGPLLQAMPAHAEPYTLAMLVKDLHTGAALFGDDREWIWIDVLGGTLVMLGLTGSWMWARSRRRGL